MKIRLIDIAHGRSGDKGDSANIGIIAYDDKGYEILKKYLTADRVKKYFEGICFGEVERYEMPNIKALNFILHNALGGGGTVSLKHDAQGKTLASALLRMEIEVE
ncbi:MAG: AtuA-related protein [Ignavibacteria bacterium]